jgi:hypothetical protein
MTRQHAPQLSSFLRVCQFGAYREHARRVVGQRQIFEETTPGAMSAITGSADGCPILWEGA